MDALVFEGTEGALMGNPDTGHIITVPKRSRVWNQAKFLANIMSGVVSKD